MNLTKCTKQEVKQYLLDQKLIELSDDVIHYEIAGPGNMNFTYRVSLESKKSFIIKQSPPYCAKFPQIDAPEDRIIVESSFFDLTAKDESIANFFPKTYHLDKSNKIAVFQDLGMGEDMGSLYASHKLNEDQIVFLSSTLSRINSIKPEKRIENTEMRKLNYSHIFEIPLSSNNGLNLEDITPGLEALKLELMSNADYLAEVKQLGQLYLASGDRLLHGDFYPNSWLEKDDTIFIIDPEFAFTGKVEFDFGTFIAHLFICGHSKAQVELAIDNYNPLGEFSLELAYKFAGVEVMRRLLGYAQLPLNYSLEVKKDLLDLSQKLMTKKALD